MNEYHNEEESNSRINQIKTVFLCTPDSDLEVRKKAFDKLGKYGNKGILTIKDLIGSIRNNDIKGYGFEVITRIKKRN